MGNGIGKGCHCLAGAGQISRSQHDIVVVLSNPLDEGLGHSFCYVRPDPPKLSSFSSHSEEDESFATTTFRSISGASVSANTSTPLSTSLVDLGGSSAVDRAASFASSTSFASIPLQPIPRCSTSGLTLASGPIERGFMSGPMERGFVSGPLDRGVYSGPIEEGRDSRTKDGRGYRSRVKSKKRSLINILKKVISSTIFRGHKSIVAPVKGSVNVKEPNLEKKNGNVSVSCGDTSSSTYLKDGDGEEESEYFMERKNLQWAQGKAGEDRVQVVISEEHGSVFVGIYDGFNGPDATEYLVSNLYSAVHKELEDLVWNDKLWPSAATSSNPAAEGRDQSERMNFDEEEIDTLGKREMDMDSNSKRKHSNNSKNRSKGLGKRCEESQRRWSFEGDVERVELERKLKRQFVRWGADGAAGTNHSDVLKALSDALRKTEDAYLETADRMLGKNPELALMGSCVLVMLMRGEDVYLMNVGDSRAVLAREAELDIGPRKVHQDLKRINEEILSNHNLFGACGGLSNLISLQLTTDHSTYVEEEAQRIRNDHPDDSSAIVNDRVKGYLKVTRAFGAGFLKQPKWNDALLEMFRINYVGTSPYITCFPSVYHYTLGPMDRFLILSSDGLYQYFTNEEVVSQVEYFIASFPEGDPAQRLIEEVLFRAAKKAGIDFHELLDIPQGERRRYHDDVSVIIISLEGRIWRSSM